MVEKKNKTLIVSIAQLNSHLGNIEKNIKKIELTINESIPKKTDLILFPEMFLSGYPPDDLVLRKDFMKKISNGIKYLKKLTKEKNVGIIFGAPFEENNKLYNSVFFIDNGKIIARRDKVNLPNYGVFDDKRHFSKGNLQGPVFFKGHKIGLLICEDLWGSDVCETLVETGAEIIFSINASPFEINKMDKRFSTVISRILECKLPIIYLNMLGGQDEIIFDGGSFAIDNKSNLVCQIPQFKEIISYIHITKNKMSYNFKGEMFKPEDKYSLLWKALVLSIKDYTKKNNFPGVLIGLSGGIDSAVVALLAADAIGAKNVRLVMMPSKYTSSISLEDAKLLSSNLGIKLEIIPIESGVESFNKMLRNSFSGLKEDITEENIQSRIRGLLLMALSNKSGYMVLATGNKSEFAVGYSTLYGDMCGGFAPIKDVWKTEVFQLAKWRNKNTVFEKNKTLIKEIIPERIIARPPSAELSKNQQDTDSLPPYEILDPILQMLTEQMLDIDEIHKKGFDKKLVEKASLLLFKSEFKRFQSPPGPKVTERAFGRDRRLPLTSKFKPG